MRASKRACTLYLGCTCENKNTYTQLNRTLSWRLKSMSAARVGWGRCFPSKVFVRGRTRATVGRVAKAKLMLPGREGDVLRCRMFFGLVAAGRSVVHGCTVDAGHCAVRRGGTRGGRNADIGRTRVYCKGGSSEAGVGVGSRACICAITRSPIAPDWQHGFGSCRWRRAALLSRG